MNRPLPASHSVEGNAPFHKQSKREIPTPFGFSLPQHRIIREHWVHSSSTFTPLAIWRLPPSLSFTTLDSWDITKPGYTSSPRPFPSSLGRIPPTCLPQLFHPSQLGSPSSHHLSQFERQDINHSNKYPMWIPYSQQQMGTEQRSLSLAVTYGNTHCGTVTPLSKLPGQEHSQLIPKDS